VLRIRYLPWKTFRRNKGGAEFDAAIVAKTPARFGRAFVFLMVCAFSFVRWLIFSRLISFFERCALC
jgi:hypothetical protein